MPNLFSQPKIIQPSLQFLHQGICKPILFGRQTFVLGKCPPGVKYCVLSLAFVLPSAVILSICIKYMDQFVNPDLIGQHSH